MKLSIVSLFVLSFISISANAGKFDDAAKIAAGTHAELSRSIDASTEALNRFNSPARFNADKSWNTSVENKVTTTHAHMHQVQKNDEKASAAVTGAAMRGQIVQQQRQTIANTQDAENYGSKGNQSLVSQVNLNSNPASITNVPQRPATGIVITQHPPFAGESWGNTHGANNGYHGRSGTGNGSNNAANSHSAHGLGGGDHIGGGCSGGGYHY